MLCALARFRAPSVADLRGAGAGAVSWRISSVRPLLGGVCQLQGLFAFRPGLVAPPGCCSVAALLLLLHRCLGDGFVVLRARWCAHSNRALVLLLSWVLEASSRAGRLAARREISLRQRPSDPGARLLIAWRARGNRDTLQHKRAGVSTRGWVCGKHFGDRCLVSQSGLLDGHGGGGQGCVAKGCGHGALLWACSGQSVGLAAGGLVIFRFFRVAWLGGACFKGWARSWAGGRGKVGAACRARHCSSVCVVHVFSGVRWGCLCVLACLLAGWLACLALLCVVWRCFPLLACLRALLCFA